MNEVKKTTDENGIVHFSKEVPKADVTVTIEDTTSTAKSELWNNMKREIQGKYEENGLPLDVDTLNSKEAMDNAVEILKAVETKNKEKSESSKDLHGGDTAWLNSNQVSGHTMQLDKDSDLPISMITASSAEDLIQIASEKARQGDKDSQQVLSKLTRKIIHNPKPIDMEFQGSIKDFMRNEKKINFGDSEEVRGKKEVFNNNLRKNRSNWSDKNEY